MARTSSIDVMLRLRGQRQFQAQVRRSAAELEALGVRGARSMAAFARQSEKLKNFGRDWTRNVTLPILGLGAVAGKVNIDFDKEMRNVNSIAQLSEKRFNALSDSVVGLAGPTAQSPVTLAKGMYDLVSSGFDAAGGLKVLEASANAATAGLTTTEVSTAAVAAVLNAYHEPASKAQSVSDLLFRTVDRGVISFEELAGNIGDVLPFASSLKVGLDEVGASIATMTKAGINPAETMTRIKAVMATLLKPGQDLSDTMSDLGFESGEAMVEALGFQGTLDALAKTTGGSKQELAKLFPNIRALGAALALTGENSRGAREDLAGMRDASGATASALAEQSKSISFQWNQLKAEAASLAIEMGPPLMRSFRGILGVLKSVVGWFRQLSPGMQQAIITGALLAAALGPVATVLGFLASGVGRTLIALAKFVAFAGRISLFVREFMALRAAYGVLGALRIALVMFGITMRAVMMTTGIGLLITAILLLNEKFHFLGPTLDWLKRAAAVAWEGIQAGLRWIADAAKKAWDVIKVAAGIAFKLIRLYFTPLILYFRIGFAVIKRVATIAWSLIRDKAGPVFDWIKTAAGNIGGWFKDAFRTVSGFLSGIFNNVKGSMVDVVNFVIDRLNNLIDAHNWLPFVDDIAHISHIGESVEVPYVAPSKRGRGRNIAGPPMPGAADGGILRSAGRLLVGERGPEVLELPAAAEIHPLPVGSGSMAGPAGPPIQRTIVLKVGSRELARVVLDESDNALARA